MDPLPRNLSSRLKTVKIRFPAIRPEELEFFASLSSLLDQDPFCQAAPDRLTFTPSNFQRPCLEPVSSWRKRPIPKCCSKPIRRSRSKLEFSRSEAQQLAFWPSYLRVLHPLPHPRLD